MVAAATVFLVGILHIPCYVVSHYNDRMIRLSLTSRKGSETVTNEMYIF